MNDKGHKDDQHESGRPTDQGTPLSYEDARAELTRVVEALEAGGVTLEQALDLWERGERLAATCQGWLDNAAKRIEAVRAAATAAKTE